MLKNLIRRVALFSMILTAFAAPSFAQNAPTRGQQNAEQRVEARVKALDQRLNLSDDQESRIRDIYAQHMSTMQKEMEAFRSAEKKPSREERMTQMRSRMQELDKAIEGVLNADQQKTYAEMKQNRQQRMGRQSGARQDRMQQGRMQPRTPAMNARYQAQNMGRLARELNLSNEQQQQIREIMKQNREQMQADMKAQRESNQAKMAERRQAMTAEIEKVLTPEQREKFRSFQQQQNTRQGARRNSRL